MVPEARLELACIAAQASEFCIPVSGTYRYPPLQRRTATNLKTGFRYAPLGTGPKVSVSVERSVEPLASLAAVRLPSVMSAITYEICFESIIRNRIFVVILVYQGSFDYLAIGIESTPPSARKA